MKKIALWSLMALCIGFTACDEVDENAAGPQTYPQLPTFDVENLVVTTEAPTEAIDLAPLCDVEANATVATYKVTDFPFGEYDLEFNMEISRDANFGTYGEIPAKADGNGNIVVQATELQSVYYTTISKDPGERVINVRYAAYAVNGTQKVRLGGENDYFGAGELKIQPCPSETKVEEAYYMIGTISGEEIAKAVPMSHSSESIYDDPVFTLVFNVTEDEADEGYLWKIISKKAFDAGNFDTPNTVFGMENEGDDYMEYTLVANSSTFEPEYGVIYEPGKWLLTINMNTLDFAITPGLTELWVIGNGCDWNWDNAQSLTTTDYVNYTGMAHLGSEFKITDQHSWDAGGTFYGDGGEGLLSPTGGNIVINTPAGLYWVEVNISTLAYKLTRIETLGAIGGFNSWSAQVEFTPSADFNTWTGTVDFDGGDWKIRCNGGWTINFGGSINDLAFDASNISGTPAGTHTVTVQFQTRPYTATVK